MRLTPTPGSIAGRRADRAGDPLDGLINLFDLSLVLAVGLLLAALSSIGATGLIVPQGSSGTPLQGQPPASGQNAQGQGQEVGKVYRLNDGRFVFAPSAGSTKSGGATAATGATGAPGAPGTTGATGAAKPGATSTLPPASGATQTPGGLPTD
jgi:hypothetical protein